jgi:ubiquinone/menaquinone biosynthesis C-methylase UbiE
MALVLGKESRPLFGEAYYTQGVSHMAEHVCPWYLAYTFDNPARKLIHRPETILGPYIGPGSIAVDMGCGMGFFSLGMARLVGTDGKVYALDLQDEMLKRTTDRAKRAGLDSIIETRRCSKNHIGLSEPVDFILACWMVHEVKDQSGMFKQFARIMKPEARVLIAEPKFHVNRDTLERSLEIAEECGLRVIERPFVRFSRTALLALSEKGAKRDQD